MDLAPFLDYLDTCGVRSLGPSVEADAKRLLLSLIACFLIAAVLRHQLLTSERAASSRPSFSTLDAFRLFLDTDRVKSTNKVSKKKYEYE